LYPEEFTYKEMKPDFPAKIQESNLTSMVLFLKRMDIAGFRHCEFLSRPGNDASIFHIVYITSLVISGLILPCYSQGISYRSSCNIPATAFTTHCWDGS